MMRNTLIILMLSFSMATFAHHTIKYIDYDVDRVPKIVSSPGIGTEIIFEEDEQVIHHYFGFNSAWESHVVLGHILTFKSLDAQPETNLNVHTNKRSYVFIIVSGNKNWRNNPNNSKANYSVRMRYNDEKSLAKQKQRLTEETLDDSDIASQNTYIYSNYDMRGTQFADHITPLRIWDNGILTFVKFKLGNRRAVIYEIGTNDKEGIVNHHTEKNGLVILHGVYPRLMIRYDNDAVEIRRNDIGGYLENNNKTTVDGKQRTITEVKKKINDASNKPGQGLLKGGS